MTRPTSLLIVDPSTGHAETQGTQRIADMWGGPVEVRQPALRGDGPSIDEGHPWSALVVMGSASSVFEDHRWLRDFSRWLIPVIRGDVERSLLGICFGQQLIAHLAGGPVDFLEADRSKCLAYDVTHVTESRWLEDGEYTVVASHREALSETPPHFITTGRRKNAPYDVIEHTQLEIFGVQFHPEARDQFAETSGLGRADWHPGVDRDGDRILQAFFDRVREREDNE